MSDEWISLMEKLKAPISENAVSEHRENSANKFIPIQWYQYQLEKLTNSKYSLELIKQHVNIEGCFVECIVRLHIGAYYRDGFGFHLFSEKNKIANALDLAYAEAFRGTVDSFLMGWHELGIYKKFGMNEAGAGVGNGDIAVICVKCSRVLTMDDQEAIKQFTLLRQPYHLDCVPNHLRK